MATGPEPPSITVDVVGVTDFATELRHEVDANLRPFLADLVRIYNLGVNVGNGVPSPNMLAARTHYQECLASIIGQLDALARGGAILADAAAITADQYRNADVSASTSLDQLDTALAAAETANPEIGPKINSDGTISVMVNGRWAQ